MVLPHHRTLRRSLFFLVFAYVNLVELAAAIFGDLVVLEIPVPAAHLLFFQQKQAIGLLGSLNEDFFIANDSEVFFKKRSPLFGR